MAETTYALNDPEDRVEWSNKLNREALKRTFLMKFAAKGKNTPVTLVNELSAAAGSQVHIFLRMQGSGDGRQGDDQLEGFEENLTTHRDTMYINQLRHAFRDGGRMSNQRVTWSVRDESKDALADWFADRFDTCGFNQLCGNTALGSDTIRSGNNAAIAPSTAFYPGVLTTDEGVQADSTAILTTGLIDKCVNKAQTMSPVIRPIKVDGKDHYIFIVHPNVVRGMRDSSSDFHAIWLASMQGGIVSDNPIINGSLGVINDVIFYSANRITNGVHSSTAAAQTAVRRNVFLGAQALGLGFGEGYAPGRFEWVEETFDYGNKYGVASGSIYGMKKTVFNSVDYGVIVVPTYAANV